LIPCISQIANYLQVDKLQLLDGDASHIFNVSNNKLVNGIVNNAENVNYHGDDYKEKYIKILEAENERLKSGEKKK
jgi:hypothetical protein